MTDEPSQCASLPQLGCSRRCPMSMDRDYQTKDKTYDAVNGKLIIGIGSLAAVIAGLWFYFSWLFEVPIPP